MDKLIMPATITGAWDELTDGQIQSAIRAFGEDTVLSYNKPRFCVKLLLAVLGKKNGNGHLLSIIETNKAISLLGDKQNIGGNFNHNNANTVATSTRIWIEEQNGQSLLYLEGVVWNRRLTEDRFNNVLSQHKAGKLGASWEIDNYRLEVDKEDPTAQDVLDFTFDGWALCLEDVTPAELATKGQVEITAKKDGVEAATEADKQKQQTRSAKYSIGIKEGGNVTKPGKYSGVPDGKFGDPTNFKYPIDKVHIVPAVQYFNHSGQRTAGGYTSAEWAIIGGRIAKVAGKGYTYKAGKIVTPSTKEADMSAGDMVRVSTYGDLPVDMLQSIRCPICGERGRLKKLDFVNGVFELECTNSEYDAEKPSHTYGVSITVKAKGRSAAYALVATKEAIDKFMVDIDGDDVGTVDEAIEVMYKQLNEEVDTTMVEYTDEQKKDIERMMDEAKTKGVEEALVKQKEAEEALVTQKAEMDAEIAKQVAEVTKTIGKEAVKAYVEKQAVVAKRVDEAHAVLAFETEEAKLAAKNALAEMSEDKFTDYLKIRTLEADMAKLKAGSEEVGEDGKPIVPPDKEGDIPPATPIVAHQTTVRSDFGALSRAE